jgi:hypothetical protein
MKTLSKTLNDSVITEAETPKFKIPARTKLLSLLEHVMVIVRDPVTSKLDKDTFNDTIATLVALTWTENGNAEIPDEYYIEAFDFAKSVLEQDDFHGKVAKYREKVDKILDELSSPTLDMAALMKKSRVANENIDDDVYAVCSKILKKIEDKHIKYEEL